MFNSIAQVLAHLDAHDPAVAATAHLRRGCLAPWADERADYGRAALTLGQELGEEA